MEISVIICSYNRIKFIPGLLKSLENQDLDMRLFEVVLIDNNSDDGTAEFCSNYSTKQNIPNFRYIFEGKPGLSHARNRGITESIGEVIVFIDDDALACPEYLSEIHSFFNSEKSASCIGGKILPKYESKCPEWMSMFLEPVMSVINLGDVVKEFPKNKFPIGANMAFRKTVFEAVGLFNTELGRTGKKMLGGEEKDLFYRIRKTDLSIFYLPKAWIDHIIPDERLTFEFIRKQAVGIGYSERLRAANIGKIELLKSYIKELMKWAAVFLLSIFYGAQFQFSKTEMLIKFRWFVSYGLFSGKL